MRDNWIEVITGAVVLAVAVAFVAFATAGTGAVRSDTYDVSASFSSIEGVDLGTDVRMGGVKIGSVTGIGLNPTTFRADLTVSISDAYVLPDDSSMLISSEGLLGGNFVEIQPGGSPFDLEPGGVIVDTQSSVSLITLLLRFVGGGE